jgi:hypothetical protein
MRYKITKNNGHSKIAFILITNSFVVKLNIFNILHVLNKKNHK